MLINARSLPLWASAWPAARTASRDLPLGVAGPIATTARVEKRRTQREGTFEIHRYADEAVARTAIEHRTVYGAVVATDRGTELLTACAASPFVAQTLQQTMIRQAAASGARIETSTWWPSRGRIRGARH
ncbi:hypothetical protein [Streptomyces sp. NPDC058678]|uniref:hypothetical protein n=1 Tax=Streptomyces sp. NPDC058678 TaxID=3346595 RepID=UPI00365111ED